MDKTAQKKTAITALFAMTAVTTLSSALLMPRNAVSAPITVAQASISMDSVKAADMSIPTGLERYSDTDAYLSSILAERSAADGLASSLNADYGEYLDDAEKKTLEECEDGIEHSMTFSEIQSYEKRYAEVKAAQESEKKATEEAKKTAATPVYTSGTGLTASKGAIYFNGHKETYYSQKVLPGTGLNIPGRHVAEDGTVRDGDGYICVASDYSFCSYGSIIETSLGMGKVYDCGCAYGIIDIYTNW